MRFNDPLDMGCKLQGNVVAAGTHNIYDSEEPSRKPIVLGVTLTL